MNRVFCFLISFTIFSQTLAQSESGKNKNLPKERVEQVKRLIDAIKQNSPSKVADLIGYPLTRPNPIPDIQTKPDFIKYYPILFDKQFKNRLIKAQFSDSNTINKGDFFGLLDGDIWFDADGMIITINYNSPAELALQKKLDDSIKAKIYPSVKNYKENVLVCKTKKYLIRIDLLDNEELRYTSWSNPKPISEKPDLILYNGCKEFQGS